MLATARPSSLAVVMFFPVPLIAVELAPDAPWVCVVPPSKAPPSKHQVQVLAAVWKLCIFACLYFISVHLLTSGRPHASLSIFSLDTFCRDPKNVLPCAARMVLSGDSLEDLISVLAET